MSTGDKTRRPPPAPDVGGEEELDLGRYWSLVAARWWLPLLGLIGGAIEASMNETIAALERISGRRLDVRRQPPVPGDQRRTNADTTRIRRELGWSPEVSLEAGLEAQWSWAAGRVAAR